MVPFIFIDQFSKAEPEQKSKKPKVVSKSKSNEVFGYSKGRKESPKWKSKVVGGIWG